MADGNHVYTLLIGVLVAATVTTVFYVVYINESSRSMDEESTSDKEHGKWTTNLASLITNYRLTLTSPTPKIWPEQDGGDRIIAQLAYVPPNLNETTNGGRKLKTILLYNTSRLWIDPVHLEQQTFLEDNCSVNTCRITTELGEFRNADAVIFSTGSSLPEESRPNEEQIWVLHVLESPDNTPQFHQKVFNWTVSYRSDSDVPNPYGKFFLYNSSVTFKPQSTNYAVNKTKKVAWFVSNCYTPNKRTEYAIQLSKHIQVDVYGSCGSRNLLWCPRSKNKACLDVLKRQYKFYLAFENSNCKDYITEKFFYNALGNKIIPIVMGARREDYERAAPYHSFIHVDDFASPRELAKYLHKLDMNDTLYNEYFQWVGTGEFSPLLNAHFWCRFCAMLHANIPKKTYDNVDTWWRPEGTCVPETWRNTSILL